MHLSQSCELAMNAIPGMLLGLAIVLLGILSLWERRSLEIKAFNQDAKEKAEAWLAGVAAPLMQLADISR